MNILQRYRGGYPFFITQKETEHGKIPLLLNFLTALDAPFVRFAPAALKSFRHSKGGWVHMLTETPKKYLPPQQEILTVPY